MFNPMERHIFIFYIRIVGIFTKRVFFSLRLLGSTHSRLFQWIWNLQSLQASFFPIPSSFYCDFLISLGLLSGECFSVSLFMYHYPTISINKSCLLCLYSSGLGSGMETGILLENCLISSQYIVFRCR